MGETMRREGAAPRIFAVLLILIGAVLVVGGTRLVLLSGSPYYVAAGVLTIIAGLLTWRGQRQGAWTFGVMLLITTAWAIFEVGCEGWSLAPRIIAPLVLGLWFLMPHVRRGIALIGDGSLVDRRPFTVFVVALVGAIGLGAGLHAIGPAQPADPIYRVGMAAKPSGLPVGEVGVSAPGEWGHYGGSQGGARYSPLEQITPENVSKLEVAWKYQTGHAPAGVKTVLQVTPLKVGNSIYICTGSNDIISLDAETGKENWRHVTGAKTESMYGTCRGVAYYRAPQPADDCPERIITGTVDARLVAVDAKTGQLCRGFGDNGQISLLKGIGEAPVGYYYVCVTGS